MSDTSTVPLFNLPPSVATQYPTTKAQPASGTVVLYAEKDWNSSKTLTLDTSDSIESYTYAFKGTTLQDSTRWVAFNLPTGVVLTLLEYFTAGIPGQPYNFASCGRTLDLIGNGQLQTVDLTVVGCGDCMSAFVWRNVDLNSGAFQMFEGANFAGNRNTFFLAEWPRATSLSLENWYIQNRASSAYYGALTNQLISLNAKSDFTGGAVSFAGWLSSRGQGADLSVYGLNDTIGAWKWDMRTPLTTSVAPFSPPVQFASDSSMSISSTITGTNASDAEITDVVTIDCQGQQSVTVSVTDTLHIGGSLSVTVGYKETAGVGVSTELSLSLTVSMAVDYTQEQSKALTATQTIDVSNQQTVAIPPRCNYTSELTMTFGRILPSSFSTMGTYYYDVPVPGSTPDSGMSLAYGRPVYAVQQTVTGRISGGIATNTYSNTTTTPIAPPTGS